MGKKRTANKTQGVNRKTSGKRERILSKASKKKLSKGVIFIEATFNNTKILFTEINGNVVLWITGRSLGFNSTQKATPYVSAKVAEAVAEKMTAMGVREIDIIVRGVGSGRESAIRTFLNRGFDVNSIKDKTPIPHNGPRKRKPRRV